MSLRILKMVIVFIIFGMLFSAVNAQVSKGRIIGRLVDAETGEPMIGANVLIEGTMMGAACDLEGKYIIANVPPGMYHLIISMIGYARTTVKNIVVTPGEVSKVDASLKPEIIETEGVVVTAEALKNTEASLLKYRQRADAVSDAISSESISRTGSSDAADAMKYVTGASVVGGKYVYIRGLGERYSNTQLNGAELPSADPDKRAFQMDLLPSNLLENIITKKTFTPDEPGNFSGGIVNIATKTFPEKFSFKLSTSASFNSQTSYQDGFLSYRGGSRDWLGMDDGFRSIPDVLKNTTLKLPSVNSARKDAEQAYLLDRSSKAFNSIMYPEIKSAPLNQSYSLSIGNQLNLLGREFGYLASASYNRKFAFYDHGKVGRWELSGHVQDVDKLNVDLLTSDVKGSEEVSWGGLATLTYKFHPKHKIGTNFIYSQSGESVTRYQNGIWPDQLAEGPIYETRSLLYTERNLRSTQLHGEHIFDTLLNSNIEWNASFSSTTQDEPDLRFFSNDYLIEDDGSDTLYSISSQLYSYPTRFYRTLNEKNKNVNLNIAIPLHVIGLRAGKFKFGGSYNETNRNFRERRFEIRTQLTQNDYDGHPENYFSSSNTGIVDSTGGRYYFGNYVVDFSQPISNYDGSQHVSAAFGLIDLQLLRNVKLLSGVRFETTRLNVISQDSMAERGHLKNDDWLPSINLIYQLNPNMNFRLAYGRTLARPTMRELSPYSTFEFIGDYLFKGNPGLKRTSIDNFDIRWELFSRPGEIYAISGFYKNFINPIERTINIENARLTYQNVDRGRVYGIELEVRKRLDALHDKLVNFHIGSNFTLVRSSVDIPAGEYAIIEKFNSRAEKTRPLFGQSPYLFNVELGYQNPGSGTTAALYYNVFGSRLSEVAIGAAPDVYERSRSVLDFTFSQLMWSRIDLKLSARNLLDAPYKQSHMYKGTEYIYNQYKIGRTYSIGLSYNI